MLVPPPVQLTLERQLNKSILIGWNPPPDAPPGSIESYHVYVNGLLKTTVRASERTRALVEGVDSTKVRGGWGGEGAGKGIGKGKKVKGKGRGRSKGEGGITQSPCAFQVQVLRALISPPSSGVNMSMNRHSFHAFSSHTGTAVL